MQKTILQTNLINKYQSKTPVGFYDPHRGHTGEDYAFAKGTTLLSPFTGTVVALISQVQMGKCLYLRHDASGFIWVFAHAALWLKKVGEKVNRLDPLMITGDTGSILTVNSKTGQKQAHLHVECITPYPVNPEDAIMKRPELHVPFNGQGFTTCPSKMLRYEYHLYGINPLTLQPLDSDAQVPHNPNGF